MSEPTVQVPVSLIKALVGSHGFSTLPPNVYDDVRALLSQPTPTAEPCAQCGGARFIDTGRTSGNYSVGTPCPSCNSAPPSIADMAPGTTFTAAAVSDMWRWAVRTDGQVVSGLGVGPMSSIDPSTIRDVAPPEDAA